MQELYSLISIEKEFEKIYKFSSIELQEVNEAIDDADNGRYFTQKKSGKLIAGWLQVRSNADLFYASTVIK